MPNDNRRPSHDEMRAHAAISGARDFRPSVSAAGPELVPHVVVLAGAGELAVRGVTARAAEVLVVRADR